MWWCRAALFATSPVGLDLDGDNDPVGATPPCNGQPHQCPGQNRVLRFAIWQRPMVWQVRGSQFVEDRWAIRDSVAGIWCGAGIETTSCGLAAAACEDSTSRRQLFSV